MMLRSFDEKRDFIRMGVTCTVCFRLEQGGEWCEGQAHDLSASGLKVSCDKGVPTGSRLEISVAPLTSLTPPLEALVEVVRSEAGDDGCYELGLKILEIKPVA